MDTELRKNAWKTLENVRKHQASNNRIKKELFSVRTELSYNNFFSENEKIKKKNKYLWINQSISVWQYYK